MKADHELKLVKKALFPELNLDQVASSIPEEKRTAIAQELVECAMWKKKFGDVLKEMMKLKFPDVNQRKRTRVTANRYKTGSWLEKLKAIFFWFHPLLENRSTEVICRIFNCKQPTCDN
eukprot:TRINITY_DN78_c0_g2_i3.p1 TRINITY_DN78_c0_g2~~TRINITY_DN78_c0_g2_i3.p1  ORF type:complete len:119 (-),score=33.37 TRINITY_DN78_c0_g2_i3:1312-1668(-)